MRPEREKIDRPERSERERVESPQQSYAQSMREVVPPPDTKPWGYSGMDLINSGAAFWQNYSGMYFLTNSNYLKKEFS